MVSTFATACSWPRTQWNVQVTSVYVFGLWTVNDIHKRFTEYCWYSNHNLDSFNESNRCDGIERMNRFTIRGRRAAATCVKDEWRADDSHSHGSQIARYKLQEKEEESFGVPYDCRMKREENDAAWLKVVVQYLCGQGSRTQEHGNTGTRIRDSYPMGTLNVIIINYSRLVRRCICSYVYLV